MEQIKGLMQQDQTLLIIGVVVIIGILGYQLYKQGFFDKFMGKKKDMPVLPVQNGANGNQMPMDFSTFVTIDEINAALKEYETGLTEAYNMSLASIREQADGALAALSNGQTPPPEPYRSYSRRRF